MYEAIRKELNDLESKQEAAKRGAELDEALKLLCEKHKEKKHFYEAIRVVQDERDKMQSKARI